MNSVFLSIGSNIGNRKSNIDEAIYLLSKNGFSVLKQSNIIETKPYGEMEQNHFLNLVISTTTIHSDPFSALEKVKTIESQIGRVKTFRWGPRLIDVDILFWDQKIVKTPILTIPHYDIQNRDFVLFPLLEICPFYFHPVLKTTIINLWNIYKKKNTWYHEEKLSGG
jgi:2-amino-4-hydroxy-6-hydroxymethyldihydropteridine diphosphokinase